MFPPVILYSGFVHFSVLSEEHIDWDLRCFGSLNFTKSESFSLFVVVPGAGAAMSSIVAAS
jgi:hypothetical protein